MCSDQQVLLLSALESSNISLLLIETDKLNTYWLRFRKILKWTTWNASICGHTGGLYWGEIKHSWREIIKLSSRSCLFVWTSLNSVVLFDWNSEGISTVTTSDKLSRFYLRKYLLWCHHTMRFLQSVDLVWWNNINVH